MQSSSYLMVQKFATFTLPTQGRPTYFVSMKLFDSDVSLALVKDEIGVFMVEVHAILNLLVFNQKSAFRIIERCAEKEGKYAYLTNFFATLRDELKSGINKSTLVKINMLLEMEGLFVSMVRELTRLGA
jgi:hypothetical protein